MSKIAPARLPLSAAWAFLVSLITAKVLSIFGHIAGAFSIGDFLQPEQEERFRLQWKLYFSSGATQVGISKARQIAPNLSKILTLNARFSQFPQ